MLHALLLVSCLPVLASAQEQPADFDALFEAGSAALGAGRLEEAVELFERCSELRPADPSSFYFAACGLALLGERDGACDRLERAIDAGFLDGARLRRSAAFVDLREDGRFVALLSELDRRWSARAEEDAERSRERLAELERRAAQQPVEWRDGHVGAVWYAEFSPDGERVLTAASDSVARLWDAYTGECVALLEGHEGLASARFSADGERALTAGEGDGTARLWDGRSGELVAAFGEGGALVTAAAFGPGGDVVLLGDHRGGLALASAMSGEVLWALAGEGAVTATAFAPGGDALAVGRADGGLEVRRSGDGELLARLEHGLLQMQTLLWAPDRRRLLALDVGDGGATLWDCGTWRPVARLDAAEAISSAQFVAEGRFLLTSSAGEASVWDAGSGELVRALGAVRDYGIQGSTQWADLSPDGERLLVVRRGGFAELLDFTSGETLATLADARHSVRGARFGPDGARVLSTGGGWVHQLNGGLWDGRSGELLHTLTGHSDTLHWGAFSPDGARVVTAAGDGRSIVWNARSGERVAALGGHLVEVRGIDLAADGDLLVACGDTTARLFDGTSGRQTRRFAGEDHVAAQTVFPMARLGFHRTPRVTRKIILSKGVNRAVFDRTGERVVAACLDLHALVWSRASGALEAQLAEDQGRWFTVADLSPAGDRLATFVGVGDGALWDWPSGERLANLGAGLDFEALRDVPGGSDRLAEALAAEPAYMRWIENGGFDPGGEHLLIWGELPFLFLLDGRTGAPAAVLSEHDDAVNSAEFSADGARLVSASDDGSACVWRVEDGALLARLVGHQGPVEHAVFDPRGARVLTGGQDGRVGLWDAATGERLAWYEGHPSFVGRVAVSPDGERGLSSGANFATHSGQELAFPPREDCTVRVWDLDARAPEPLAVLEGGRGDVLDARFSPDGRRILVADAEHTVRIWSSRTYRPLATHVAYAEGAWLTFEPGGHYVASGRAADWARVRVDGLVYPLSCYAELLERPEHVAASLAEERVPRAVTSPPPTLAVVSQRAGTNVVAERRFEVQAAATDRAGVRAILVRQDGVALDDVAVEFGSGNRQARLSTTLTIPEGHEETVVALQAVNRRGVRSREQVFRVRFEPGRRDLYLLALGVQEYDRDDLDLACPRKDVDDLIARFEAEVGRNYGEVHVERLVDAEVTSPALKRLRETFLRRAQPDDTILVFVAGHGVRSDSGEYYFLTARATPEDPYEGVERSLLESLVTWDKLHASRRVLLLDTCQSGEAFGEGRRGVGLGGSSFEQDEVDRAAGSGLYIIAASAERGYAVEVEGNGLFTRALLDGLDGAADRDGDGLVGIEELKDHASRVVHERSGGHQRPTVPTVVGGADFPLAHVPD